MANVKIKGTAVLCDDEESYNHVVSTNPHVLIVHPRFFLGMDHFDAEENLEHLAMMEKLLGQLRQHMLQGAGYVAL
ncbi:hypothetical protein FRX31_026633 [Thalictrum thalictroides]|uniref:Uncharacterized protein n=1 Tax=Thalictrum thalictroides TaxID=46969 RepID=A0A7J6VGP1_THATH|nr:hypothetical protein FRX31_026633 [Thalictrum thalictroides]